jgi:hypothetical protein
MSVVVLNANVEQSRSTTKKIVMAGLVPAIHALIPESDRKKDVDARHKAGHDEP